MTKKTPPFSLRLTFEERARLEELAGDMPLGAYIRRKVFDGQGLKKKRARARSRRPIKDEQKLAQVLAMLGQSRIANNLNQLAKSCGMIFFRNRVAIRMFTLTFLDVRSIRDWIQKIIYS